VLGQTLLLSTKENAMMKTPSMEEKKPGFTARSLVTSSTAFTRVMEQESTSSTDSDAASLSILLQALEILMCNLLLKF